MTELTMCWAAHSGSGRWHRLAQVPIDMLPGYVLARCGVEFHPGEMDGALSPYIPARWVCQRCVALDAQR